LLFEHCDFMRNILGVLRHQRQARQCDQHGNGFRSKASHVLHVLHVYHYSRLPRTLPLPAAAVSTLMGKLRAANGPPAPYKVKWWGIGNEMWGDFQDGHMVLSPTFALGWYFRSWRRRIPFAFNAGSAKIGENGLGEDLASFRR